MNPSSEVNWASQGNSSNPNRRPLWDFKVSSDAQAEKRRVCPHSTSHERCCPGAKLIYFGSVPRSDSFLGFHLRMIFLMPDNTGFFDLRRKETFHLRASFSIGQTSTGSRRTQAWTIRAHFKAGSITPALGRVAAEGPAALLACQSSFSELHPSEGVAPG